MIKVKNVTKYYGKNLGILDVSFDVEKNEIIGILGRNGAGKTTVMNIMAGYISPDRGNVEIFGYDIIDNARKAKQKIGYLPEKPPIYMDMTVNEYLNFCADLKAVDGDLKKKHIDEICTLTMINNIRKRLCKNLSKGYKQRVGLAQALVGNPEILILDEPTIGLDPDQIIEARKLIKSLSKNHTIIISSHVLSEISQLCQRVIIMDNGKVAASDTLENLTESLDEKNRLIITLTDSDKTTEDELKKIKNITDAEYLNQSEEKCTDFMITYKQGSNAREGIFKYAVKSNKTLLMMKPVDVSLEDIFLNTVKRNEGSK